MLSKFDYRLPFDLLIKWSNRSLFAILLSSYGSRPNRNCSNPGAGPPIQIPVAEKAARFARICCILDSRLSLLVDDWFFRETQSQPNRGSGFLHLDPKQASSIPSKYKPEDHTPAAAVAKVKNSGGICVKTYFERGFGRDRNLPVISAYSLAEIRKDATQAGLVLIMHANSFEAQKFAVDGDVDVIAHGMWDWGNLENESELPAEIKRLLDHTVDKRNGYRPTIQVMGGLRAYFDPQYLTMQAIPKVIPAEMLE